MGTQKDSGQGFNIISPSGQLIAKAYNAVFAKRLCLILNDLYFSGEKFDDTESEVPAAASTKTPKS